MPVARPLATFAPRKLLARGLAAAPQFALRAHPTRPLRGGRIALVGQPDRLRRQANVFKAARWSDGVFDIGMRTLA